MQRYVIHDNLFERFLTINLTQIETQFDAGQYKFEIEPATFSMADYDAFVASIQPEIDEFRQRQAEGVASQEARCVLSLSSTMSTIWICNLCD